MTYKVHRFIGYDPISQAAFSSYLGNTYAGNIKALNDNWRTSYSDFDAVVMPRSFPAARDNPAFHDLIQWRQQSVGGFIASGAKAARAFDPNHLITYSMVGGIFNGNDANNTCEDAVAIVASCKEAGAPLDFWSINNYAWALFGSELRTGDFGVSKYREQVGLPIMISETGHSSTENLFEGAQSRQAKALPGQVWESLISGAIGTHIFHWNDRDQFTRGYFDREKGFGIVHQNRRVKEPVYSNVLDMFRRMQDVKIERLIGGSANPPNDILFFWPKASDIGFPRANQENAMLWGALKRVGYQPGLIDDDRFQRRTYTNSQALILSRAWQMNAADLDQIETDVLASGIHVHANADLPGQFDTYLRPNPNWKARMQSIFGLDVSQAVAAYHSCSVGDEFALVKLFGQTAVGSLSANYTSQFLTWRIWHGLKKTSGTTVLTDSGLGQAVTPRVPALHFNAVGSARTAMNSFGLGDTYAVDGTPKRDVWSTRYDILRAIYRDHFRMTPVVDINGSGAKHVLPDYRILRNGTVLISVLNEDTNTANIRLAAPSLLRGMKIENITHGGIVTEQSDGALDLTLADDEYVLLYAYPTAGTRDESLINAAPLKVWFDSSPLAVRPDARGFNVTLGYDTLGTEVELSLALESSRPKRKIYSRASAGIVGGKGKGLRTLKLHVPDPDLNDLDYISSSDGGEFRLNATLTANGVILSEAAIPIRLAWGIRPGPLPQNPVAGQTYDIPVVWQELPSFETGDVMPLDRARLWESLSSSGRYFNLQLDLHNAAGQIIATQTSITDQGSGSNTFRVLVPRGAIGPFNWSASLLSAPKTGTHDVMDSFEGCERGSNLAPFYPWFSYVYSAGSASILEDGIAKDEISAFANNNHPYVTVANPASAGANSGFGLIVGTNEFALPANRSLWSNFTFSFDFKEAAGLPCILEMQVKDNKGGWIQFARNYQPSAGGWDTVRATLAEFVQAPGRPVFDPAHVGNFALNIRMSRLNATYVGYFDNMSFVGPITLKDTFDDRTAGPTFSKTSPWAPYGYDGPGHNDVLLNPGVHLEGTDGSQSVFLVARYKPDGGDFAGFGMSRAYPATWSLPVNKSAWKDYKFSFDFKEANGRACIIELQLKNKNLIGKNEAQLQRAINFTRKYTPRSDGWDTISATLDQFVQHPAFPTPFDPAAVDTLIVNVAMLERSPATNVVYVASIDNIRFNGPETLAPGETLFSSYTSANDFFGVQSITVAPSGELNLTWTLGGKLQFAENVEGPWIELKSTANSISVPMTGQQRFYRLQK